MKSGMNNNSGSNGDGNGGKGYNEIIHLLDSDTEDDGTTKVTTTKTDCVHICVVVSKSCFVCIRVYIVWLYLFNFSFYFR